MSTVRTPWTDAIPMALAAVPAVLVVYPLERTGSGFLTFAVPIAMALGAVVGNGAASLARRHLALAAILAGIVGCSATVLWSIVGALRVAVLWNLAFGVGVPVGLVFAALVLVRASAERVSPESPLGRARRRLATTVLAVGTVLVVASRLWQTHPEDVRYLVARPLWLGLLLSGTSLTVVSTLWAAGAAFAAPQGDLGLGVEAVVEDAGEGAYRSGPAVVGARGRGRAELWRSLGLHVAAAVVTLSIGGALLSARTSSTSYVDVAAPR
jgi:hypothetical protein